MEYRYDVKNPLWETLKAMTGVEPPGFCKGIHECTQLMNDELVDILHGWCVQHANPVWSTGIGLLEAAEEIVTAAVQNGNIAPPDYSADPSPSNRLDGRYDCPPRA